MGLPRQVAVVPQGAAPERPASLVFDIPGHRLVISGREGRWRLTVDERPHPGGFATTAEAWAAGVREAERHV
jgi:hypothetical protein